jgi:hypothetical protein
MSDEISITTKGDSIFSEGISGLNVERTETKEYWNGHVYIVCGGNSTIRHDSNCPCLRRHKTEEIFNFQDTSWECFT